MFRSSKKGKKKGENMNYLKTLLLTLTVTGLLTFAGMAQAQVRHEFASRTAPHVSSAAHTSTQMASRRFHHGDGDHDFDDRRFHRFNNNFVFFDFGYPFGFGGYPYGYGYYPYDYGYYGYGYNPTAMAILHTEPITTAPRRLLIQVKRSATVAPQSLHKSSRFSLATAITTARSMVSSAAAPAARSARTSALMD
jgi:hypothetical protein